MGKSMAMPSMKERDWQTEDDLRILSQAKEIEKDPKRMAKCKAMAKEKMLEMAAVANEAAC